MRLPGIGLRVQIDMADAVEMLDHRHPGDAADPLVQLPPATRDDHINAIIEREHGIHCGAIRGLDQLYRPGRQIRLAEPRRQAAGQGQVGVQCLAAAAQNHRVAGLQAQHRRIHRDIRARFIDDADHPERHPHARDFEPARALTRAADPPDRIGQPGDLLAALDHLRDALRIQCQAVIQGAAEIGLFCGGQIQGIGLQNFRFPARDLRRDAAQGAVFLRTRHPPERA